MTNKKILAETLKMRKTLYDLQRDMDSLLGLLQEEEIARTFKIGQVVTIEYIQKEFGMGYASTHRLVDDLEKQGYIRKKGVKSTTGYTVIKEFEKIQK
jgi:DNA-binding MarR family transcriptional regulator